MRSHITVLGTLCLAACSGGGNYIAFPQSASAPGSSASRPKELILPLEVDASTAETFVRIGFGLQSGFQSTEFLTPRLRTAQAAPLIRLIKQYNNFEGERVALAVERLRGKVSGIEFGRQGSPVLFIELPYWTHQREETMREGMGVKISDAENEKFVAELRQTFVSELKADEFSVRGRRVRVWWG